MLTQYIIKYDTPSQTTTTHKHHKFIIVFAKLHSQNMQTKYNQAHTIS